MSDKVLQKTVSEMVARKQADEEWHRLVVTERLCGRRVDPDKFGELCRSLNNPSKFEITIDEALKKPQSRLERLLDGRYVGMEDYRNLQAQHSMSDAMLAQVVEDCVTAELG